MHQLGTLLLLAPLGGSLEPSTASTDALSRLHPMHDAIASFGAVVHEDWIYVAGGHVGKTHSHSIENLSAALVRYHADDLSRREALPASAPLQSVALVSDGRDLYRVGGLTAHNETAFDDEVLESVDTVARLDDASGLWQEAWTLPAGRSSHDAVAYGGRIYLFGGWQLNHPAEPTWYDHGLVLDTSAGEPVWEPIAQPFQRRALAVAAAGGRLFCLGGITSEDELSPRVDVYDVFTETWSQGPDLPCGGFGITAIGLHDRLYVAGTDGVIYRLAADGSAWEVEGSLAMSRYFARLVAIDDDRLAVFGGVAHGRHVAVVEEVTPSGAAVERKLTHMELDYPGETRQRHAAFVVDDTLYLFGGNRTDEAHRFEEELFSSEGWKVDLLTGEFEPAASMPAGRQSMAVAVDPVDAKAYLAGGFGFGESDTRAWDEVFVYDVEEDAFELAPTRLAMSVTHFGIAVHKGRVHAFGGLYYDEAGDSDISAKAYTWHPLAEAGADRFAEASLDLAGRRRAFAGALHGGEYVMLGGMGDDFAVIEDGVAVDLASGAARPFPMPEFPRVSGKLVEVGGNLVLAGGSSRRAGERLSPDRTVEVFDATKMRWEPIVADLPLEDVRHMHALAWRDRLLLVTAAREGKLDLLWLSLASPE